MSETPSFAVILIRPQLGENIGMVARAMLNCGLTDLRLVRPRDGWPSEKARASASGADIVIDNVQVFETTEDAIADLNFILATTTRTRDMTKGVFTPEGAAKELRNRTDGGGNSGILFGRESAGLDNDDIALADAAITVPLNPDFTSLNLAQAVLLIGYEWYKWADKTPDHDLVMPSDTRPAERQEVLMMLEHLESELDARGFLRPVEKRPVMVRNIRNVFWRAGFSEKEVRTFRGIITALTKHKRRY